ncbi:4'-phosphopantetheinyl transferase superfamily protein [Pseudaeromonas sp. ZJS20]|uniref:4'-phosphopantetheinyl transferase family protein n=1 Tax=Pseudaeromonas aegiceratis TaxID=3153928 RepID=UPI00390C4E5C
MPTSADIRLYLCRFSQWQSVPQAQLLAALADEERCRCQGFSNPTRQRSYALSRYLLRQRLASRLDRQPSQLRIVQGVHGRPELAEGNLHFNLSHSGDWLAIAVGPHPLGVDVEADRPPRQPLAIARRFFAQAEYAYLASLPADTLAAAFWDLWCLKEAVLKAHGGGLQAGLDRFVVQGQPPRLLENHLDTQEYRLANWRLDGLHLALASQGATALPALTPQRLTP